MPGLRPTHEPELLDTSDPLEYDLAREASIAYETWRASRSGRLSAWENLNHKQRALWADAVAGVLL